MYHFQYNFQDQILYLIRDPWEEFRFHYTVWENRSIHLLELGIPESAKADYKTHWDGVYLTQRKWIENLKDLRADEDWIRSLTEQTNEENFVSPVSGLGYFNTASSSQNPLLALQPVEIETVTKDLKRWTDTSLPLEMMIQSNNDVIRSILSSPAKKTPFTPPLRYKSMRKEWENVEQKKFFREYFLSPISFLEESFITLNGSSDFSIEDSEKIQLESFAKELETQIHDCVRDSDRCTGMEEIVLLVRLYSVKESLNRGYFVIPKKANYEPFYYPDAEEIPESVLAEKKLESVSLFKLAKKQFLEGGGELSFREWEKDIARIDSLQRQKFDIANFESYPAKKGDRKFRRPESFPILEGKHAEYLRSQLTEYENAVKSIYPYHIILQNCTGEIFRYHNQFYAVEAERNSILGGTVSEKTRSLSFIPFVAAMKVRSNYSVPLEKKILSYRLQKKNESNLSPLSDLKEDIVPLSSSYKKNPYDQEFLFFTDDTIVLRPIFGLTNIIWGLGYSLTGVFTSPWDKGKNFSNGVRSVFFSFPELAFMNIRKGYFPYVTQKDLPRSYYQKVYE